MNKNAPATTKQLELIRELEAELGQKQASRIKSKILKKGKPLTQGRAHAIINHMISARRKRGKHVPVKRKAQPSQVVAVARSEMPPSEGQLGRVRRLEQQIGFERAEKIKRELGIVDEPTTRDQAVGFQMEAIRERAKLWRRVWPGREEN